MPTKLQALKLDLNPRVVFLSYVQGEFSTRVRNSLYGKINGRVDKGGRLIEVIEKRPGRAGDESSLLPWEKPPTDVVVLFSDDYVPECVSHRAIAQGAARPELNAVLRLREDSKTSAYQVWFGVVQDTSWQDVPIEGHTLADFQHLLHLLHPDDKHFCNDRQKIAVLDSESRLAGDLMKSHDPSSCPSCSAEPGAEAAPEGGEAVKPAPRAGFFRRLFSGGG